MCLRIPVEVLKTVQNFCPSVILVAICVELRRKESDIFPSVKRWEDREKMGNCVCVFVSYLLHAGAGVRVYAACTANHSLYMLVMNPLGNGGGIPVTMEMFKLICNKIST